VGDRDGQQDFESTETMMCSPDMRSHPPTARYDKDECDATLRIVHVNDILRLLDYSINCRLVLATTSI
jgi:hypothetical protein